MNREQYNKEQAARGRARSRFSVPSNCQRCGIERTQFNLVRLEIHHKDGNPTNNDPSNIEFLCRKCHMITDGRIVRYNSDKWKSCINCGEKAMHLRKKRCRKCYN